MDGIGRGWLQEISVDQSTWQSSFDLEILNDEYTICSAQVGGSADVAAGAPRAGRGGSSMTRVGGTDGRVTQTKQKNNLVSQHLVFTVKPREEKSDCSRRYDFDFAAPLAEELKHLQKEMHVKHHPTFGLSSSKYPVLKLQPKTSGFHFMHSANSCMCNKVTPPRTPAIMLYPHGIDAEKQTV